MATSSLHNSGVSVSLPEVMKTKQTEQKENSEFYRHNVTSKNIKVQYV